MRAIEILEAEHRHIERVLVALSTALERDVNEQSADTAFFLRAADFIRDYADGSHHAKEEKVLFAALATHGMPLDAGPLGCMMAEHEQSRLYAREMAEQARSVARGSGLARAALLESAWSYARLMTAHIQKEDEIIFKIARRVLTADKDAELVARYAQLDPAPFGSLAAAAASVVESLTQSRLRLRRV